MKIISGGQTGADRTALEIARELGVETGGYAPLGWKTDEGPDPSLAEFGLRQCNFPSYRIRTRLNVQASHGTVIFGDTDSPGCTCTINACLVYERPYIENPTVEELVGWIQRGQIAILNVAGNRRRTNPGIIDHVRTVLRGALWILRPPLPTDSTPEAEAEAAEIAIAGVTENAGEEWRTFTLQCLQDIARRQGSLTSEDVWDQMREYGTWPQVHDNRAMGGIFRLAAAAEWIQPTESWVNARRMAHRRPLRIWQSRLYPAHLD